jgi:hypothetical protein
VIGVELETTERELDVFAARPLGRYDQLTIQLAVHLSGSWRAGLRPFHVSNLCVCAASHGYLDGEIVGVLEKSQFSWRVCKWLLNDHLVELAKKLSWSAISPLHSINQTAVLVENRMSLLPIEKIINSQLQQLGQVLWL